MAWFDVHRKGLAKLIERRGKAFAIFELIQNAWDEEGTTRVDVSLEQIPGKPQAMLRVEDDAPEGFKDITHAYTLFAESAKKGDPTKRGRFNWGEKLVLALCYEATIHTTTGRVIFSEDGKRKHRPSSKRQRGSVFSARIRMTRQELQDIEDQIDLLHPPEGIDTYFNERRIAKEHYLSEIEIKLPTIAADDEGNLKRTIRKTTVGISEPCDGQEPMIFEMGIPVCKLEGGERWHVDVGQKVPLSMERDNVTPGYLRTLRVHVMNAMRDDLEAEDAVQPWARDAAADERCEDATVKKSLDLRFGKKRVKYDPSDPEANKLAMSKGYTVIHGRSLHRDEWRNVERAEAAKPAGQVTPSPKPYSEHGDPVNVIDPSDWTEEQRNAIAYIKHLHRELIGCDVDVMIVRNVRNFAACYSRDRDVLCSSLDLSLQVLGHKFFRNVGYGNLTYCNELMIHEFAHYFSGDHLSSEYHKACCKLGAKLADLAIEKPEIFVTMYDVEEGGE